MPARLDINIVGKANGAGVVRDANVLADALLRARHNVQVIGIDSDQANRRRSLLGQLAARTARMRSNAGESQADLNVMLEHIWPQYLAGARANVVIPDPSGFDRHDLRLLSMMDQVWTKNSYTSEVFAGLGLQPRIIGFDSPDCSEAGIQRARTFLHVVDGHAAEGVGRLLRVWSRRPNWPRLIVAQDEFDPQIVAANIHYLGRLGEESLRALQNHCMFHVCLCKEADWGQCIAQAMSVGAVTITLDAPPMNELVSSRCGLLVPCTASGFEGWAPLYEFDDEQLEATIAAAVAMSRHECALFGRNARSWFVDNKRGFSSRLMAAVEAFARDESVQ